ncbi:hypothetical protein V9K67_09115 [Paraflavisolibacter sp. H34]|uniref:dCTP deaminase domain-containing protein n=1 Tax=Huijunlia imazamoxiresistens TaxID=3127457 RepID=UPI0030183A6E
MSFLGANELKELLPSLIEPFRQERIENAAYELSLGKEVFSSDSKSGKIELLDDKNRTVEINPGQFALLLTEEKISVPKDKIAFISIKAGEKLKGLVNVSGFHVDPGFSDHLLFSVYNAGPSTIILESGKPYFPIWYCELKTELNSSDAYNKSNEHYNKLAHIPPKYIESLKRGELASPNVLLERIKNNEHLINNLKWAAGILITLSISIFLKTIWDLSKFNEGYSAGIKEKQLKSQIDTLINKKSLDSLILLKVDSILKAKHINNLADSTSEQ